MKWTNNLISKIKEDPNLTAIHKQVLIARIEQKPTMDEIRAAEKIVQSLP